ncbi:hypothetical protein [Catenovulum adriaticum]|uniref:TIGR03016 family PEP-CTERM system-associated outer membrane protein n=1 Tax=Catenovulum adriaticum TaxID=2984846 RepID=A0ABY7AMD2_9ALTE|nr:hypothetical protein [Catenovulum sp. TS8]WAJ70713.1 hypothetical protein OLW01_02545 [Catenovulum sp. TS8]
MTANAGDLQIKPAMSVDYYKVDSKSTSLTGSEQDEIKVNEQVIKYTPSLAMVYESRKLNISSYAEYIKTQHKEEAETDSEFLNYNLTTDLEILADALNWRSTISKSHRVADSRLGSFSDEIVGSENLTGVTNLQTDLTYQIVSQHQLNLLANVFYRQTEADDTVEADLTDSNYSVNNFDTSAKGGSVTLGSGPLNQGVGWNVNMAVSQSDRANQEDYTQSSFSTDLDIPLSSSFGWVLNARIDKNKIDNDTALSDGLSYREYGTGLRWSFTRESYINLLAYRSKTGEQETQSYIGGEINWIPSSRSSLMFSANRNQFGENYQLDVNQNSRFFKTRASYSEGVDINSRRQFVSGVVGSFVCPIEAIDFTQCFQPTDPNYQMQPGEQQFDIIGQDIELNDEVVKFSSGALSLGYDNTRKLKLNISYVYSQQRGLEGLSVGNDRKTQSVTLAASYAISPKTRAVANLRRNENTYESDAGDRVDKNTSLSFFINKQLSQYLSTQIGVSRRERDSNAAGIESYDTRFNAQISYQY